MYNPNSLHRGVTWVQGGNVTSPHRYTPLHRQAGRHKELHKFIVVNVRAHISYSCIWLLWTCATSSSSVAPRQQVTAKIASVAPWCQTWQLIPDNFSYSCIILMISSAKKRSFSQIFFWHFLTYLTRLRMEWHWNMKVLILCLSHCFFLSAKQRY